MYIDAANVISANHVAGIGCFTSNDRARGAKDRYTCRSITEIPRPVGGRADEVSLDRRIESGDNRETVPVVTGNDVSSELVVRCPADEDTGPRSGQVSFHRCQRL